MDNKRLSCCDTDNINVKLDDMAIDISVRQNNLKLDNTEDISRLVNKFCKPYKLKYKQIYKENGKYKTHLTDMTNTKFGVS